jgi:hypothetical protein
LAWAKWIDALGEGDPTAGESPEGAEERLRAATEAAERARLARERAAAPAEVAPELQAETQATHDARARVIVPRRHDPETGPARPWLAPAATFRPADIAPSPPARIFEFAPAPPAATGPSQAPDRLGDEPLPDRYEDDRITLIGRDPYWLHTYWDLSPASVARAHAHLGQAEAQLVLRVHHSPALEGRERGQMDIEVNAAARNWYVYGGRPGHAFEVEIGLRTPDGRFVPLARSNQVTTPLDRMSKVLDEKWRSLAEDYDRMYALSGGHAPLGSASGEMSELTARRSLEFMGSGAVSSFGISSAGAGPPRAAHPRGFWFVLGTELIVYGATAPHATVTCQGRPVPLRQDGTFTLRFALPDGAQTIDCRATSADRVDSITITPRVTKTTTREEERHRTDGE